MQYYDKTLTQYIKLSNITIPITKHPIYFTFFSYVRLD